MEQSPSLEADSRKTNSTSFMEPKDPLLFSQEPAIGPCPEPDQSSRHPRTLFL
jgi:hypothetical protein